MKRYFDRRKGTLNNFNSYSMHHLVGLELSNRDLDYILDSFCTMEVIRMLQARWRTEKDVVYNPCLVGMWEKFLSNAADFKSCSTDIVQHARNLMRKKS